MVIVELKQNSQQVSRWLFQEKETSCCCFLTECGGQDLGLLFPLTGIPANVQADGLSHKHSYESLEEARAFPVHPERAKETRGL